MLRIPLLIVCLGLLSACPDHVEGFLDPYEDAVSAPQVREREPNDQEEDGFYTEDVDIHGYVFFREGGDGEVLDGIDRFKVLAEGAPAVLTRTVCTFPYRIPEFKRCGKTETFPLAKDQTLIFSISRVFLDVPTQYIIYLRFDYGASI